MLNFEEYHSPSCANFEEYRASVSQHPGNIYGSLVLYKVSPSCAEFRRISSFCITASGKYLRQCLFYIKFLLHVLNFEEYQASVPQHPGNIYPVLYKVSLLHVLNFEEYQLLYHSIREIFTVSGFI